MSNVPAKHALQETLWAYHTTPNSVTGVSPFISLKGRKPKTNLTAGWLHKGTTCQVDRHEIAECIVKQQNKYTIQYDNTKCAKTHLFKQGEWVRIDLPKPRRKMCSQFSEPLKIVKVGKNVV